MGPTIGVLSDFVAGGFQGLVISGVHDVVRRAGGRVLAIQTAGTGSDYHRAIMIQDLGPVAWGHIDGFIVVAKAVPISYLAKLRETGKALISVCNEVPDLECPVVVADNSGGARLAVEHLLAHGHRRIAFVGYPADYDIQQRYEAYREALSANGVKPDEQYFFPSENNLEHGAVPAAQAMLAAGLPSTAVFAATDLNAVSVMKVLKAAGLRLPQDQAVVGYDDDPDSVLVSPALSTVSQDPLALGRLAGQLALKELRGERVAGGHHVVPTSFVVRNSCGCSGADLAPSPGAVPVTDPVTRFLLKVGEAGSSRTNGGLLKAQALACELRELYSRSVSQGLTGRELLRIAQASEDLYGLSASRSCYDAIASLANELEAHFSAQEGDQSLGAAERLSQCTYYVQSTLSKRLLADRNDAYYELRKMVRDHYKITLELLDRRERDPRLLDWLKNTDAKAGVLGIWSSGTNDQRRQLDIVGTYTAEQAPLDVATGPVSPENFPPEGLFAVGADGSSSVYVFPLKSTYSDWGYLAVSQPSVSQLHQESCFTWSALFSEALHHRDLLESLSQRNNALALSYQREREMANAVRESEERYALAGQATNDGLWDLDVVTGKLYLSPRLQEMLDVSTQGLSPVLGAWVERIHPDDRGPLTSALGSVISGEVGSFSTEHRLLNGKGEYIWAHCRALGVPGKGQAASRVVGSVSDVTERKLMEGRLRQQALYDELTGLANRGLLLDRLAQAMAVARRRSDYDYAVVWLDLDDFKQVNDIYGHLAGDALLKEVAARISTHVRETDTAARFGGDEFVLLLQVEDAHSVEWVVRRMSDHLGASYDLAGAQVHISASVGVALGSPVYEGPEEILRDADAAMYTAKSAHLGGFSFFVPTTSGKPARERLTSITGPLTA